MTETKVTWEEITDLEQLRLGDEVEYKIPGENRVFTYWGEVKDIERNLSGGTGEVQVVRVSGCWNLLPSSLTINDGSNTLKRKVVAFVWPDYVGACVEATKGDLVYHYVRLRGSGHNEWVVAENGEFYATWELEVISDGYEHRVLGRGY